jgi:hypothetical protein
MGELPEVAGVARQTIESAIRRMNDSGILLNYVKKSGRKNRSRTN